MKTLSKEWVPDKNGDVEIELYGGPLDGLWVETAAPVGASSIVMEDHWRYIWDGEEEPLNKFRYIQDLELEMSWIDKHQVYEDED